MKRVDCAYASEPANGRSVCARGYFDGSPTFGQCVNYCARRKPARPVAVSVRGAAAARVDMAKAGPPLWAELHGAAAVAPEWLAAWAAKLPCGDCRAGYRAFAAANPPRFDDFFAWGVELHNAVNRKLGKPELSIDAARERWAHHPNSSDDAKQPRRAAKPGGKGKATPKRRKRP